jgi:hypothetical protein
LEPWNRDFMTSKVFRRLALGLEGAVESAHMGHPDFRAANGRIFATLTGDEKRGMASLTPDQQADFIERSSAFSPAAGAWGRGGSTLIDLAKADEELVGEAITLAWQRVALLKKATTKGTKNSKGTRRTL